MSERRLCLAGGCGQVAVAGDTLCEDHLRLGSELVAAIEVRQAVAERLRRSIMTWA
jgi:hypothetical protein